MEIHAGANLLIQRRCDAVAVLSPGDADRLYDPRASRERGSS